MKIKLSDVFYYVQGHIRYYRYYFTPFLLRKHIKEQIDMRIRMMNPKCFERGTCIECGCKTTHLQMSSKICEGECYPRLFTKKEWRKLIQKQEALIDIQKDVSIDYYNHGTTDIPNIKVLKFKK